MKIIRNKKLYMFSFLLALILCGYVRNCSSEAKAEENRYTELEVNNPYKIKLKMEIKCDFKQETKKWEYHKIIIVEKRSSFKIHVPNGLKQCQCWPLEVSFF